MTLLLHFSEKAGDWETSQQPSFWGGLLNKELGESPLTLGTSSPFFKSRSPETAAMKLDPSQAAEPAAPKRGDGLGIGTLQDTTCPHASGLSPVSHGLSWRRQQTQCLETWGLQRGAPKGRFVCCLRENDNAASTDHSDTIWPPLTHSQPQPGP